MISLEEWKKGGEKKQQSDELGLLACEDVTVTVTIAPDSPVAPAPLKLTVESLGTNKCNPDGEPPKTHQEVPWQVDVESVADLDVDSNNDRNIDNDDPIEAPRSHAANAPQVALDQQRRLGRERRIRSHGGGCRDD